MLVLPPNVYYYKKYIVLSVYLHLQGSWATCCKNNYILEHMYTKGHCVKSVHIRSFFGLYYPAFGLNPESYSVSLRIQSEFGKIWTRKTPNTNIFHAVGVNNKTNMLKKFELEMRESIRQLRINPKIAVVHKKERAYPKKYSLQSKQTCSLGHVS